MDYITPILDTVRELWRLPQPATVPVPHDPTRPNSVAVGWEPADEDEPGYGEAR